MKCTGIRFSLSSSRAFVIDRNLFDSQGVMVAVLAIRGVSSTLQFCKISRQGNVVY